MTARHAITTLPGFAHRWQLLQVRLLSALAFSVLLPAVTCSRVASLWLGHDADRRRSVFTEAREASGTVARLAFAG